MLELLLEGLFYLVVEVLFQMFVEVGMELGWESLTHALHTRRTANPVLAGIGLFILGAGAGAMSAVLLPEHLVRPSRFPGIALLVVPVAAGSIMQVFGTWRTANGHQPSFLATFWGGAVFAFAMVGARLALIP